jgi:hypothetical protein
VRTREHAALLPPQRCFPLTRATHARTLQLSLLERDASGQSLVAVASITAEVEDVAGTSILVVTGKPSAKLEALVDIPLIMGGMASAIRRAVITSRPPAAQ